MDNFKKYWNILSGIALFIVNILTTFLMAPPEYLGNEQTFTNWGKWVATIVVGLILVLMIKFKAKKYNNKWWLAAVIALILSAASFFSYSHFRQKWTCSCYSEDKLILNGGLTGFREPRNVSVTTHPDNCTRWLKDNQCNPQAIWTKESIDNNRLILVGIYTIALSFLIATMMSVVQALYCLFKPPETND